MPDDLGTFDVYTGDAFTLAICGEEDADGNLVNLASYGTAWSSQLRVARASDSDIPFTVDTSNITGGVDSSADAPQLVLSLTGPQTEALTRQSYVFDVQVTGGPVTPLTLYTGQLRVTRDVTR